MKCFHFSNEERRSDDGEDDVVLSVRERVSWAHSLSIASSTTSNTEVRRSEFAGDSEFIGDSARFFSLIAQNRGVCNNLKTFTFVKLKTTTHGFSRGLMIGEGGFGCVYRGVIDVDVDVNVRVSDSEDYEFDEPEVSKVDVAVKQLNCYGSQGHKEWINEVNWLGVINTQILSN